MASASCSSSTSIPRRELFCCPHPVRTEKRWFKFGIGENGTTTSHPAFQKHLLFCGKTVHRLSAAKEKRFDYSWKYYTQIPRKWIFKEWSLENHQAHLIKAVATVEPNCLVPSGNSHIRDSSWQFDSKPHPESQSVPFSNDDSLETDEKERLRRMKISKANKGNVPWNKGRKHSPETLQRIRERTRIAMQDPKVKMKLVNLGHAQSEETRIKIGVGVREGWQRRREMLMVQERCLLEWQNIIAKESRKGYASEDELQWDSYKVMDEQLKHEWLESVEKRKTMPRPKGSKRAPKSPEQRRKISLAISAKWADPGYRDRVCSALSKYHGVPVGGEKKPRTKATGETSSGKRESVKRKSQPKEATEEMKMKSVKEGTSRRKRNATPSYKDPMVSSKLEMIKKIRAERAALETKKIEATERAKLLIAEAEKAAKALEVAALKSPLAQASLLETRKLIAEATRSIESIESGQLSHGTREEASFSSGRPVNHFQASHEPPNNDTTFNEHVVNGSSVLQPDGTDFNDYNLDRFTLQNSPEAGEPLLSTRNGNREDSEVVPASSSPYLQSNNVIEASVVEALKVNRPKVNGFVRQEGVAPEREGKGSLESEDGKRATSCTTKTKKWVRGRLVEIEG